MKVLVDMNLSPGWIDFLVNSGFQAVHWSNIGRGDEADAELMRWAAEHAHVVLTPIWISARFSPRRSADSRA